LYIAIAILWQCCIFMNNSNNWYLWCLPYKYIKWASMKYFLWIIHIMTWDGHTKIHNIMLAYWCAFSFLSLFLADIYNWQTCEYKFEWLVSVQNMKCISMRLYKLTVYLYLSYQLDLSPPVKLESMRLKEGKMGMFVIALYMYLFLTFFYRLSISTEVCGAWYVSDFCVAFVYTEG